jgi:hypothetical protein
MISVDFPIQFNVCIANQFILAIHSPDDKWYFSTSKNTNNIAMPSALGNNTLAPVEFLELLPAFADSFGGEILD